MKGTSPYKTMTDIVVCDKCFLIDCCCEADRLQVIADNERAKKDGYVELPNGKWVKVKNIIRKINRDGSHIDVEAKGQVIFNGKTYIDTGKSP
jgi:hypothetical protein